MTVSATNCTPETSTLQKQHFTALFPGNFETLAFEAVSAMNKTNLLLATVLLCSSVGCGEPPWVEGVRQKGRAAYLAGVPAEANPHQGTSNRSAEAWLDGWIAAKQEETK